MKVGSDSARFVTSLPPGRTATKLNICPCFCFSKIHADNVIALSDPWEYLSFLRTVLPSSNRQLEKIGKALWLDADGHVCMLCVEYVGWTWRGRSASLRPNSLRISCGWR